MIEVDLVPDNSGGRIGRARRLRSAGRVRAIRLDAWVLVCSLVASGSLGTAAYLVLTASRGLSDLEVAVEEALRDSARSATGTRLLLQLHGRRDSAIARISMIEGLDITRYQWPHILDEVAAALPESAWITGIASVVSSESELRFQVEGRALDNFALTRFWNALEASFFIRNVQLISTEHLERRDPGTGGDLSTSYRFVIGAEYESPPDEVVEFVRFERGAP